LFSLGQDFYFLAGSAFALGAVINLFNIDQKAVFQVLLWPDLVEVNQFLSSSQDIPEFFCALDAMRQDFAALKDQGMMAFQSL